MTKRFRDTLTIGMALLTILLCGYAVGFLLGEKKGRQTSAKISLSAPGTNDKKAPWVERTLTKFDRELSLTAQQQKAATTEIEKTYDAFRESRSQALRQYSSHIIALYSRLLPHLDDLQKKTVQEQHDILQSSLDLDRQ